MIVPTKTPALSSMRGEHQARLQKRKLSVALMIMSDLLKSSGSMPTSERHLVECQSADWVYENLKESHFWQWSR
jgi:hypothetical protein